MTRVLGSPQLAGLENALGINNRNAARPRTPLSQARLASLLWTRPASRGFTTSTFTGQQPQHLPTLFPLTWSSSWACLWCLKKDRWKLLSSRTSQSNRQLARLVSAQPNGLRGAVTELCPAPRLSAGAVLPIPAHIYSRIVVGQRKLQQSHVSMNSIALLPRSPSSRALERSSFVSFGVPISPHGPSGLKLPAPPPSAALSPGTAS